MVLRRRLKFDHRYPESQRFERDSKKKRGGFDAGRTKKSSRHSNDRHACHRCLGCSSTNYGLNPGERIHRDRGKGTHANPTKACSNPVNIASIIFNCQVQLSLSKAAPQLLINSGPNCGQREKAQKSSTPLTSYPSGHRILLRIPVVRSSTTYTRIRQCS